MSTFEKLGIATIDGGDCERKVNYQLQQAIKNAMDINTLVDAKRIITLKISMKPNNTRDTLSLDYEITAKLPCDAPGADIVQVSPSTKEGYVPSAQMTLQEMIQFEAEGNSLKDELFSIKTGEAK